MAELAHYISVSGTDSRNIYLSGTVPDKLEAAENLFYMTGIISDRSGLEKVNLTGTGASAVRYTPSIDEITAYARRIDQDATAEIERRYHLSTLSNKEFREVAHEYAFELYVEIILPTFNRSMFPPETSENHELIVKYLDMNRAEQRSYINGVQLLAQELGYNEETGQILGSTFKPSDSIMTAIEMAKVNAAIRDALEKLREDPDCKIFMAMNYIASIELAYTVFSAEKIGFHTLTGSTPMKDRNPIREEFNADNNDIRVLICQIQVIKEGISFADDTGRHFRYAYISPSIVLSTTRQATSRVVNYVYNYGSKTMIIFGNVGSDLELKLLDKINEKDERMKRGFEEGKRERFILLRELPTEGEMRT